MTRAHAHPGQRRDHDALLPLVNIALLLLVFFLTVGKLAPPPPADIMPLQSRSDAPAPLHGLTVSMKLNGALTVNGEPVPRGEVQLRLAEGCGAARQRVLLRADARTPTWDLVDLLETLKASGCRRVDLLTVPLARR